MAGDVFVLMYQVISTQLLWISGLFRSYMSQHMLSLGVLGLDLGLLAFSHIFSIFLANAGM